MSDDKANGTRKRSRGRPVEYPMPEADPRHAGEHSPGYRDDPAEEPGRLEVPKEHQESDWLNIDNPLDRRAYPPRRLFTTVYNSPKKGAPPCGEALESLRIPGDALPDSLKAYWNLIREPTWKTFRSSTDTPG